MFQPILFPEHSTASEADAARHRPALLATQPAAGSYISPQILVGLASAIELVSLTTLGLLAGQAPFAAGLDLLVECAAVLAIAGGTVAIMRTLGLYHRRALTAGIFEVMPGVLLAVLLAFTIMTGLGLAAGLDPTLSRGDLAVWLSVSAAGLVATRLGLGRLARCWAAAGRLDKRVAIYGAGPACADLVRALEADVECGAAIVGIWDERGIDRVGSDVHGYPRIGNLDGLIAHARSARLDTVLVTLPIAAEQRLMHIVDRLSVLPAEIRQPASVGDLRLSARSYDALGSQPMLALIDTPITGWGLIAKSAFDKLIAGLAILMLAPVLAFIAVAIKVDSRGPVLFRQKRYGFNNELIGVLKFRSMYAEKTDASAERLVTKGDPRVTRVGRFIRKTSLDELPQLFNVLFGELSLVGPRPHAVSAKAGERLYGDVVGRYHARHRVKPGITGWAQVNGWRGETDTEEKITRRVEHDLHYIANWSLWLDLKILARTPLSLLDTDSAY